MDKLDLIFEAVKDVREDTRDVRQRLDHFETTQRNMLVDIAQLKERDRPRMKLYLALGGLIPAIGAGAYFLLQ